MPHSSTIHAGCPLRNTGRDAKPHRIEAAYTPESAHTCGAFAHTLGAGVATLSVQTDPLTHAPVNGVRDCNFIGVTPDKQGDTSD
jgi:hypothetical protein